MGHPGLLKGLDIGPVIDLGGAVLVFPAVPGQDNGFDTLNPAG